MLGRTDQSRPEIAQVMFKKINLETNDLEEIYLKQEKIEKIARKSQLKILYLLLALDLLFIKVFLAEMLSILSDLNDKKLTSRFAVFTKDILLILFKLGLGAAL